MRRYIADLRGGADVRSTLWQLLLLCAALSLVACAALAIGVDRAAETDARRGAEQASEQLATAVLPVLAGHDYADADAGRRQALLDRLSPYLGPGIIYRIKVWSVEAETAEIVFSDEQRIEGERRVLSPQLLGRTSAGDVVVLSVPDDAEHRYEIAQAGQLLEVFTGFTDSAGRAHLMELYLPVATTDTARNTAAYVLPVALGGFVLIGLGLVPIAYGLARRLDRGRDEHRDALRYGLAAEELARRELAQRLHDDVLPDLASASLLLDTVEHAPSAVADHDLLVRVRSMIHDDVARIRGLLHELTPAAPAGQGLSAALEELASRASGVDRVVATVEPGVVLDDPQLLLLYRAAGELLRNVGHHAGASTVQVGLRSAEPGTVVLSVTDDGVGFDPAAAAGPGHVGLTLVRRAVDESGGRLVIDSTPGAGSTVSVELPQSVSHAPGRGLSRAP